MTLAGDQRAPRRWVSHLAEAVVGRLLFRHVPVRPELVALMREEAAALDAGPAVDVLDLWDGLRRDLVERLRHDDPAVFLRWPPVQQTMVVRSHRRVRPELAHLRGRADWRSRWRHALRETTLGAPRPYPQYPWTSGNLIYNAYHACRFEEAIGRSLASMQTIVEFGGGYGRLCQLVHDLGFSGTYVIFDLPEVAVLQRFYLRHVGIPAREAAGATWSPGVVTVVDPGDLRSLLGRRQPGDAAFVAVGSLSEAPVALRDTVLADVASFDAFLLFYAARQDAIDNLAYFEAWRAGLPAYEWHQARIPHLGKDVRHLFGHRR